MLGIPSMSSLGSAAKMSALTPPPPPPANDKPVAAPAQQPLQPADIK